MGFTQSDIVIAVFAGTIVLLILASFGIIFTLIYKKKQQANKREKHFMQSQFNQAILQTQIEIQEHTLKNISQEIHDNIGQVLSLAKLNLNTLPTNIDAATQTKVEDSKHLISKALRDLRDLSRSLHGHKIAELGLQESITAELKIIKNTGQFNTSLHIDGSQYRLGPQKEMVLFRMVQEALHNAIKHSKAKNIEVHLQYGLTAFRLSVNDNGTGFNPATLNPAETGIGVKNMQNRAALIGAIFSLNSNAENGTQISIELKNLTP